MPSGPSATVRSSSGESAYSGIMDAAKLFPAEVPSFWQVYITVDDVAATVKQAEALGAEILMPGEETPWGHPRGPARSAGCADLPGPSAGGYVPALNTNEPGRCSEQSRFAVRVS